MLTFECVIDARQGEPGVAQLEHNIRAAQESGEVADELAHMARVPGWRCWEHH